MSSNSSRRLRALFAAACAIAATAAAAEPDAVQALQQRWAEAKYAAEGAQQQQQFEALAADAAKVKAASPDDPRALIWEGIILASYAGAKGGLGALSLCKSARADFEAALAIDPAAMDGSAYTSLGSLYYQVPGWPLGFGDDDKARELLRKGLEINPQGIDANYFYGDFLRDQGDYAEAVPVLEKALAAPPRAGRELADQGRRAEIEQALAQAREHLDS